MLSLSFSRLSTSFILSSALRIKVNNPAIEQEKTTTALGAADLVISNSAQPLLLSRYLDMLVKVDEAPFIRDFLTSLFT
jgi:hypothetical protein